MATVDSGNLLVLDQFERALAEATSFDEVNAIRNKAEAVRHLAKHARMSLEVQNRAAEVKLRAERKAGQFLAQLKLRGGDRRSTNRDSRVTLSDLGISQNESKRWQQEATIPEEDFQYYVRRTAEFGEELTATGLLRLAHRVRNCRTVVSAPSGSDDRGGGRPSTGSAAAPAKVGEANTGGSPATATDRRPCRSADEFTRLLSDLFSHHALLCQMLAPLCHGEQDAWLPGQRRGTWHYLSEVGRLLMQLAPIEPAEEEEDSA